MWELGARRRAEAKEPAPGLASALGVDVISSGADPSRSRILLRSHFEIPTGSV